MKTATALALIAIGAILAFAITKQPLFFNLHIAGWVLIADGCRRPCRAAPPLRLAPQKDRQAWRARRSGGDCGRSRG